MATRRSEWLASIKPILDRDEAKKDAAALAKELGDILEVKVDASPENLDQLAKEFNTQLKTMGKQPIVFSEKTLRGIVSQFTKAISEGISAGVAKVDFSAQLEALNKKRESVAKKYEKANRTMQSATRFRQLERFEVQTAHTFKVDDNIEVKAKEIAQNIYNAAEIIKSAKKQYGANSNEYIDAVLDGQEAYNKYLRMQKTFNEKLTVSQKLAMSSDVTSLFDRRSSKNEELEWFAADNILDHFEDLSDVLNVSAGGVNKLKQELAQIDNEIARITQSMNGAGDSVVKKTENGLRTLDEIQKKYEKFKKNGKNEIRLQDQPKRHIEKATQYIPKENDGIKVFAQEYKSLETSDDWVEKYSALVRYVKLYESYLTTTNKTHRNKVTDPKDPYGFTALYNELKPMAENAQNMLQNILNLGEGKPLVGMGGEEKQKDIVSKSSSTKEDVNNAKQLGEETEKQLQTEKEKEDSLQRQRATEEKIADAQKAATESRKEELGLMQAMDKFQSEFEKTDRKNETLAFVNTKTGNMSELFVGNPHSVTMAPGTSRTMSKLGHDMEVHSHSWKTAAPSVEDFESWFKRLEYIKKFGIRAGEELLSFDFSGFNEKDLDAFLQKYKDLDKRISNQFREMSYDDKLALSLEHGGINEAVQIFMRRGLEDMIKTSLPNAMSSMKMPDLPVDRIKSQLESRAFVDVWANASEEVKALIKELAILERQIGELDDKGIDAGDLIDKSDAIHDSLPKEITSGLHDKDWEAYVKSVGGGASSSELEAERAKAESLQNEIEQKNSQLAEKDAALQTANNEKQTLQNDLDIANRQNAELRERASNDGDAIFTAEQRANEAEEKAAMYDRAMTSMQEEMADLRGKLAGAKTSGEYSSASLEELKNVLSAIVYNVKIAHDDDKTANKIALDDSTLEATLTKVFANILNPQTQQNDSEQTEKHWALESTLQSVKGVLDNIQTNTAKIGVRNPSSVDTIAGTALDGRLVEIKSVLESINGQIVKGGVITTRGSVKQAASQPVESEVKAQSARSNMMKSLINDYKTMGKLAAQFASDNNLETKATLANLKEEIARKRQSLKISMDENKSLREKYSIAFNAEKRLIDAAKAQAEINNQNRQNDRDEKTAWKKQVKDAQRATGINAATSAANAGDQTVLRAIGTNGISQDVENKAKELSEHIKTLRVLRDEIDRKGNQASDADRDKLSKQISKVKELKSEVDGYLKIHEKYSGDNVTDLGDASNFGAVGTDEYWNNITAKINSVSEGKTVIKGLNADTGELTGTTRIAANTFAQWSATVDPLTGRLSMLRTGIKKTETVIEQIKRKTKEIFTYFSGSSIIFKAFNELKKGVQYVRDIDLALTELKKVTDETEETYRKFLDTASKTAAKVGSTIKDVVSSTADWARLNI